MERKNTLEKIYSLINKAFEEENGSYISDAFRLALDYNWEHLGESEIFMAEDDDYVMVCDDVFYYPEGMF